jgi:hypothetical protein
VWALHTRLGALNSDQAIVGLMALHVQHGDIATTYWGQAYGGPHEAFLVAALFAVGFGAVALEIVAIGLHAATALVIWRIGLRVSSPRAARTAAALVWIGSAAAILVSLRTFALYGIGIFLASLVVLQVLRVDDRPSSRRDWLLLGCVLGAGIWATPQFAWVAAPALLWLFLRSSRDLRGWVVAAGGAVVVAAPWLWYGATNDWDTLKGPAQTAADNGYLDHLSAFFGDGLPVAVGLRAPATGEWLVPPLAAAIALALVATLVARAVWRHGHGLAVVIAVVAAYPFLLSLSTHAWYQADGRYLYLLFPLACLLLAVTFERRAAIAVVVAGALSVAGLHAVAVETDPADYDALETALQQHGIDRAYADYWVAYRVTFDTREDVIVTPAHGSRHLPYDTAVGDAARPAYIFRNGDVGGPLLLVWLAQHHRRVETFAAGGFVVYRPLATSSVSLQPSRALGPALGGGERRQ